MNVRNVEVEALNKAFDGETTFTEALGAIVPEEDKARVKLEELTWAADWANDCLGPGYVATWIKSHSRVATSVFQRRHEACRAWEADLNHLNLGAELPQQLEQADQPDQPDQKQPVGLIETLESNQRNQTCTMSFFHLDAMGLLPKQDDPPNLPAQEHNEAGLKTPGGEVMPDVGDIGVAATPKESERAIFFATKGIELPPGTFYFETPKAAAWFWSFVLGLRSYDLPGLDEALGLSEILKEIEDSKLSRLSGSSAPEQQGPSQLSHGPQPRERVGGARRTAPRKRQPGKLEASGEHLGPHEQISMLFLSKILEELDRATGLKANIVLAVELYGMVEKESDFETWMELVKRYKLNGLILRAVENLPNSNPTKFASQYSPRDVARELVVYVLKETWFQLGRLVEKENRRDKDKELEEGMEEAKRLTRALGEEMKKQAEIRNEANRALAELEDTLSMPPGASQSTKSQVEVTTSKGPNSGDE
ncbi:hypothetical protein F5Y17DRAFT_424534 [Xylariaceae sp. FL0594]|nr:hypothetical protein F5Y17DRAFT_424534 [Xylariaceae sp. FL0594]